MEISKDILRECLGLGFVAARYSGLQSMALGVFRMAQTLQPENAAWVIGTGMVYAGSKGGPDAARQYMQGEGIETDKGDPMARAFLGLFAIMAKQSDQGEKILKTVIAEETDPAASKLAQAILDNELK